MLERIYFNEDWTFYREDTPSEKEKVRLPHTNTELPFNYFSEELYQFVSVYEKKFLVSEKYKEKILFLTFEGAAHKADVYLNGSHIKTHSCGYTGFCVDISPYVNFGEENELKVILDSRESLDIPPFGRVIDYLTYGGLYREVYIDVFDSCYADKLFVTTESIEGSAKSFNVSFDFVSLKPGNRTLKILLLKDGEKLEEFDEGKVSEGKNSYTLYSPLPEIWTLEEPNVYTVKVLIFDGETLVEEASADFGLRTAEFRPDGFYLNGKRIKIRGLNRHQSYPYVGYAMPEAPQVNDAEILKYELGVNAVRLSHYPQSQYFLDACDRLGLLAFIEAPGWQFIGDDSWKRQHIENIKEMVYENRNHPSIILWGVRINESGDSHALYKEANRVCRECDPSRQTSGVRCIPFSDFMEDVYAYNDFSHTGNNAGLLPKQIVSPMAWKPYLVSEHNGHMNPTKSFDREDQRLSQALRHARVLDDAYKPDNGVAGAFGWCMFDYNTHKDFGSGDKICYHGVMDMFRNPKMAAALYASQSDETPVLEISSSMDIGEHPAGSLGDVYLFTNADYVNLYKNDEFVRKFEPDRKDYPNLPHPPMLVDDLIGCLLEKHEGMSKEGSDQIKRAIKGFNTGGGIKGVLTPRNIAGLGYTVVRDRVGIKKGMHIFFNYIGNWGTESLVYRFEAVKDGKVVGEIVKAPMNEMVLDVKIDHCDLVEKSSYDVATVRFQAYSKEGNKMIYANDPVMIEVSDNLEIIGPKAVPLRGGAGGTFVKTKGKAGKGYITLTTERTEPIKIPVTVTVDESVRKEEI